MKIVVALAAASAAALMASAAFAQDTTTSATTVVTNGAGQVQAVATDTTTAAAPVANPPPRTTPPTTATDTGYTGDLQGKAFHDIDDRITDLSAKAGKNHKAMAMLASVKSEEKMRRARHGGELRDWDREFLNKKLDAIQGMVGG